MGRSPTVLAAFLLPRGVYLRMRASFVLFAALAAAGCLASSPAPSSGGVSGEVALAGASIVPSDASWPAVGDVSMLSDLFPSSLRLEVASPDPNASVSLWFEGASLPSSGSFHGSASYGFGRMPDIISINLTGGLAALERVDASVVEHRSVGFAGRSVLVPTLARDVTLEARFAWPGHVARQNVTLSVRTGDLLTGPAFYNRTWGLLGVDPHPAGNLHPLEDGALRVWAAGDRLVTSGFAPPRPDHVVVLVLSGMGGGAIRVDDGPSAPPPSSPSS